ncbi:MAG TPA: respiratory nitrate reductase subunit gamma [Spirochaetota bacterium]|nr:respiratory nitrate reductase subunit gamma [Spirochaetota bacterium]
MWESIYAFVMVPMVYIAFGVFVLGILYKLYVVLSSPPIKGTLGMFPQTLPRPIGVLRDSLLVPTAYMKDKVFWFFIIVFHAAFLLLFLGHLELIQEFSIIQIIPHKIFLGKGFVGIALIVSTLYFLFRRFRPPYSLISVPEDYMILLILFLTMIFGSHMSMAAAYGVMGFDVSVADYRTYLSSLVAFRPVLPAGITYSPHYVILVLHIFFANLFLILFPFSKMIHSVFTFIAHNTKRK